MDAEHRWTLLGLGAMAVALVAPHIDLEFVKRSKETSQVLSKPTDVGNVQQGTGELMLDRTLAVRTGSLLKVDVSDGDVEVRPGSNGSATVRVFVRAADAEWGRTVFDQMRFVVTEDDGGVIVRAGDARFRDSEWRDHRGIGVKVEITVPERFEIDVRTADGDVDIGNLVGRAAIRTSDGDVFAGTLTGPEVTIETSDGDMVAETIDAERISLKTSDGDVVVGVKGVSTRISTGDGDITLNLLAEGEVSLRTGDGDITIYAGRSVEADLELHAEDVYLESEIQLKGRVGGRGARGKLNGGGPLLVARTGDGTITIREN